MLEGILIVVVSPILFIDDGAQLYFLVIFFVLDNTCISIRFLYLVPRPGVY
jgi:hypothetical protein